MEPQKNFGFTLKADNLLRVLTTDAHVGSPFDPNVPAHKRANNHKKFTAVWDTGATGTVISKNVVDACNLKPTGMTKVHTASGTDTVPTYLVSVALPNHVMFSMLRVTQGVLTGTDILIGMDIINKGDFAITNKNNKTVFSFRMPSRECIDFVEASKPPLPPTTPAKPAPAVGRNDPCPCKSGKKYKKCCGKNT
jgi:hypothetical protein